MADFRGVRAPRGLAMRACAGMDPLGPDGRAEHQRAGSLTEALRDAGARLVPLFGPGQFQDERRVRGTGPWTRAPRPDLLRPYYRIEFDGREAPRERYAEWEALDAALRETGCADGVFPVPEADVPQWLPADRAAAEPAAPAPVPTPYYIDQQGYLGEDGIGLTGAWDIEGVTGRGTRIVDIECGWCLDHEDLQHNQGGVLAGVPAGDDFAKRSHGTAVLGMLGGDRNPFGVTGICPDATLSAVSVLGLAGGAAAAIRHAADRLLPGDIILVELHQPGPAIDFKEPAGDSQDGYVAVEYFPDAFAAIRYATSRGIIVVEPAGNGGQRLDDALHDQAARRFFDAGWANPFNTEDEDERDSLAIVVGAGAPPGMPQALGSRLGFSNYGARVDAQGWGLDVVTAGGNSGQPGDLAGGPDESRWYTRQFGGTSSAAPMVAGAIACVQGVLRARGRRLLTPAEARRALRETGRAQAPARDLPASQRIGRRPDVRELIDWALSQRPGITTRRKHPMRIQITIDDGGSDDRPEPFVLQDDERAGSLVLGNGATPKWRGPGYFLTVEEAAKYGVPGAKDRLGGAGGNPADAREV